MKSIKMAILAASYLAALITIGIMFGMKAVVLTVLACCCTAFAVRLHIDEEPEEEEPEHTSCEGCKHDLGGGHCRLNVEDECCEGGGFELWEAETDEKERSIQSSQRTPESDTTAVSDDKRSDPRR